MNDPKINRIVGYVIFFIACIIFVLGTVSGGPLKVVLYIIGGVIAAASVVWMILKVRCPHCGALLHLKLYNIDRCPRCGKSTRSDN